MSKIKYNISLDMHSSVSQASLAAKQGDDNRQFAITLRSGSQPYKIERGAFAVFSTILPNGEVIEDYCNIVGDEITYEFTPNLTSQAGILDIEIRLYDHNSKLITSPTFILVVSPRAAVAKKVTSSDSFTALDTLYKETNVLKNTIEEKLENGEFKGEDVNYNLVANALKGSARGNPLVLGDVSPVEHTLKVKAIGDNLSAANVVVCGANWIPKASSTTSMGITATVSSEEIITFSGTTTGGYNYILCQEILPPGTYTMRWNKVGLDNVRCSVYDATNLTMLGYNDCTFTTDGTKSIRVYCNIGTAGVAMSGSIKPMLNTGSTGLPHEPYKGIRTYPINADGTVEGVTSVSPTTTLMTDTEGVTLDVEYNRDANKVIDELYALVSRGSSSSRISYIDLPSANWQGSTSPYSQVVTIDGVTEFSKVDINPSIEQLAIFHTKDIAFVAENEDGVVTVYCIGQKPTADYQMQITITEVDING